MNYVLGQIATLSVKVTFNVGYFASSGANACKGGLLSCPVAVGVGPSRRSAKPVSRKDQQTIRLFTHQAAVDGWLSACWSMAG